MNSTLFVNLRKSCGLKSVIKYYSSESGQVEFPKRIPRGPTDILRAISNTVKSDPTAAHYKYHDDPYLIPYSNSTKRTYSLSLEAGRKAAQWIRQEHADLFQHKVADPFIETYAPRPILDETSEVSEDVLKQAIKNVSTSDAIAAYKLLEEKGIELSRETQQSLLEMLCYYNCEDNLHEEWIEERWFRSGTKNKDVPKKTWKENGLAWELFNKMKPESSESYSAIICGMCNYGQLETANKLYEECSAQRVPLALAVYNAFLAKVNFMRESHTMMWNLVLELLTDMKSRGVRPDVGTLNAVLETLCRMGTNHNAKVYTLSIIAEFSKLGIQLSLASYYHLLNIFCKDRGATCGILIDILNDIEGKCLTPVDPKDTQFFLRAMEVCRYHLRDKELAYRLDNFLHTGQNYNLIGDSYRESSYYRNFFILLSETEPLEVFMQIYNRLVPNVYVPEPAVTMEILHAMEASGELEYLPKLWADMCLFEHAERQNLLEKTLDIAASNMDEGLKASMVDIGWTVYTKIENQQRERNALEWTGKMLSNLIMIFLQAEERVKVDLVFDKLEKSQNSIIGEPELLPLQLFIDDCIKNSMADYAVKCVCYCHNVGFVESEELACKVNSSLELTEKQRQRLIDAVGASVLEEKKNK